MWGRRGSRLVLQQGWGAQPGKLSLSSTQSLLQSPPAAPEPQASQHPKAAAPPLPPYLPRHPASRHPVLPPAQLCGPLTFRLPSRCLADAALQTWAEGRAGRRAPAPGSGAGSLKGHCHWVILRSWSPVLEAPHLPLGVAGGCRVGTQAPEPLFVQAKVSLPPPSQPGLDQWPRAMARVSGPCPLWPVAPGSMGLLPGLGPHCD